MQTNLGKTKEEIIYELTLAFIKASDYKSCSIMVVDSAIHQYEILVKKGIIVEMGE